MARHDLATASCACSCKNSAAVAAATLLNTQKNKIKHGVPLICVPAASVFCLRSRSRSESGWPTYVRARGRPPPPLLAEPPQRSAASSEARSLLGLVIRRRRCFTKCVESGDAASQRLKDDGPMFAIHASCMFVIRATNQEGGPMPKPKTRARPPARPAARRPGAELCQQNGRAALPSSHTTWAVQTIPPPILPSHAEAPTRQGGQVIPSRSRTHRRRKGGFLPPSQQVRKKKRD